MSVSARPARNTHFTPSALCPLTPLPPLPGAAAVAACYSCIFYDATQVAQIMHKPMKHATIFWLNIIFAISPTVHCSRYHSIPAPLHSHPHPFHLLCSFCQLFIYLFSLNAAAVADFVVFAVQFLIS